MSPEARSLNGGRSAAAHDVTFHEFRQAAARAIANPPLQAALDGATLKFRTERLKRLAEIPDSDALRDHLKAVRSATLANLAVYLEIFERNATAAGAHVHWARDAAEANQLVIDLLEERGVSLAVKSKSMATEEIHLNDALKQAGVQPVETDLGEWIIQLFGEPPSHIVTPALHHTRGQIAELFTQEIGRPFDPDNVEDMTAAARAVLRERFLAAGAGISGANIAIAETGTVILATNEGNGRMVTSAPPLHIALVGIEKLCPTWDDAAAWLSLLARSSTGQPLTIYTSAITGPARPGDPDGPREVHIILLDNGRTRLLGGKYEEMLQCIRCGACLNACPVYQEVGDHSYGHPYSGPVGAVLLPAMCGIEHFEALPHASSLCMACRDVCPVRIDIPRMLLELRADEAREGVIAAPEQSIEHGAAWLLAHGRVFRTLMALGRIFQPPLVRRGHLRLPRRLNPAQERALPSLSKRSFHQIWQDELAEEGEAARLPRRSLIWPARLAAVGVAVVVGVWRLRRRQGGAR